MKKRKKSISSTVFSTAEEDKTEALSTLNKDAMNAVQEETTISSNNSAGNGVIREVPGAVKEENAISVKHLSPGEASVIRGLQARIQELEVKIQRDTSVISGLHTRINELKVTSKILEFEKDRRTAGAQHRSHRSHRTEGQDRR